MESKEKTLIGKEVRFGSYHRQGAEEVELEEDGQVVQTSTYKRNKC